MSYRGIWVGFRIALGLNHRISGSAGLLYHAVSNEPATVAEHDDIAVEDIRAGGILDYERVARPNRGQHAPPGDPQAQTARRAQYLARKFALEGVQVGWPGLPKTFHDALVRPEHCPSLMVFPHERALVTNTRS